VIRHEERRGEERRGVKRLLREWSARASTRTVIVVVAAAVVVVVVEVPSYVTTGHKRNEKTVQPPLKNLRGIQMLDFLTGRPRFLDPSA